MIDSCSPRRHFSLEETLTAFVSASTMKKRKDFEFDHHFTSISTASKSRRLDCDFYSSATEEDADSVMLNPKQSCIDTDFLESLRSTDFPIVVNADLIPGLKDYLLSWGIAKLDDCVEDELRREKSSEVSKDTLVAAPWVTCHSPTACNELVQETGQTIEAEAEMMDMDESNVNISYENDMGIGGVEAAGASSPWQQHCMMLNLLPNSSTPIHWC